LYYKRQYFGTDPLSELLTCSFQFLALLNSYRWMKSFMEIRYAVYVFGNNINSKSLRNTVVPLWNYLSIMDFLHIVRYQFMTYAYLLILYMIAISFTPLLRSISVVVWIQLRMNHICILNHKPFGTDPFIWIT
jgi:hypothetical protein